jgi:lysozyme family protein
MTKKMTENEVFEVAFTHLMEMEGGYVNDPDDPGGETKYGISDRADGKIDGAYNGKPIKLITLDDAKKIYREKYWNAARCWAVQDPAVALHLFDCAVNMGTVAAIKLLQTALRMQLVDGIYGPKTLAAVQTHQLILPHQFMLERTMRYVNTANFKKYGRGWIARVINTHRLAMQLRTGQPL